jgi:Rrf2 family transcriptional regulator, iron-sulfur cluster assembly transcription factor
VRLEVSRRSDLAVRALLELARTGDRRKAADLADRLGTTPGFLSQVVTPLVGRGWVRSEPGPTGGYTATVPLEAVSVLDVLEAIEGPTDTGRCVLQDRACNVEGPCALHQPWSEARATLLGHLGRTRLSSLPRPGG